MSVRIGLPGALFLVFLVLRLTDHIDWAWYWVALPLWLPVAAIIGVAVLVVAVIAPTEAIGNVLRRRKRAKRDRERLS